MENDKHACATLRTNRPSWTVLERDLRDFDGAEYVGVDLVAGGVPCPPFSVAGKQLGAADERDLFPEALRIVEGARPRAVMLENVRGFADAKFDEYRRAMLDRFRSLRYIATWQVLNACDFGVPQSRPRFVLVALRAEYASRFLWPSATEQGVTVGEALGDMMAVRGWPGARSWRSRADRIAPTVVGGSKKHGGADLGPQRARRAWAELGVDGRGIADEAPGPNFPVDGSPRLTVSMAARIQGLDHDWRFCGGKTAQYRQVGNAFPSPVAAAVGAAIRTAIST